MIPTLILFTDAIRWWGALAGMIGLADVLNYATPRVLNYNSASIKLGVASKGLLCTFLILAGTSIPITSRYEPFGYNGPLFLSIMCAAWVAVSFAGWLIVVARAHNTTIMAVTAAVGFAVTVLAAAATAHG